MFMTKPHDSQAQQLSSELWSFTEAPMLQSPPDVQPVEYESVSFDINALKSTLNEAPLQAKGAITNNAKEIELPYPDGSFKRFRVVNAPIMQPGLADKFPDIQTYRVAGIDDPTAYGRLSITRAGVHGLITSKGESIYMDPFSAEQPGYVMVYERKKHVESFTRRVGVERHEPIVADPQIEAASRAAAERAEPAISGTELREHRLAQAVTAQFTQFHSSPARCETPDEPVDCGLSAVVVGINRVNTIYERDVAVTLTLVDNNELLIYTDVNDQPYDNNDTFGQLSQNQANIDNVIGSANYDIGHVFNTAGGGVASLGSVCSSTRKAQGVSGLPQPINDPFFVDFVAHEMGHQYAATHTFNGSTGGCAGNRSAVTAYEPGSGSTIMAYAGICPGQNLQFNTDDYFHIASLNQMTSFVQTGAGSSCGVTTETGNTPPEVDGGVEDLTLPIETPFTLEGSATDAEQDAENLTYTWEQYDRGPQGPPNNPQGTAPLFRSFLPIEEPVRTFPNLESVLDGSSSFGELLPDYTRSMRFRLTVRDNAAGTGAVSFAQVQFQVDEGAGPFEVPVPGEGTQWPSGGEALVAWDVANTDQEPVGAETVSIMLSTDGGETFDVALAENAPNNGSAVVSLPAGIESEEARIKVMADEHIFFNVSPEDFVISGSPASSVASVPGEALELSVGSDAITEANFDISVTGDAAYNYMAGTSANDLPDGFLALPEENIRFVNGVGSVPGNSTGSLNFEIDADGLEEAFYATRITLESEPGTDPLEVLVLMDIRVEANISRLLATPEGWQLIGAPVEQTTVATVLQNFSTQGFPGADNEDSSLNPSVMHYTNTGLKPLPDIDYELEGGEGLLTYFFDDDLPQFLRATGFTNRSPFVMELNNQLVLPGEGASGPPQTGWNLKSNPYDVDIDLNRLTDNDFTGMDRAFQVWNPRINGGNGGYLAWNGYDIYPDDVSDTNAFRGELERFQGFWARGTGSNAQLILDEAALTADGEVTPPNAELFAAYYTLELTAGDFTTYTTVMFSEEGASGADIYDADELRPLSNDFAVFYSEVSSRPRNINSLPLDEAGGTIEIPMHVDATFEGEFTIRLANITGTARNFNELVFTDQLTGESVSLQEG
ncbi:MAG: reprolysin-like metallopeptidase, partial [Cyclonatronaceae bacterium]